ncbi:MAG: undecaprenyl-diphosphate phosphatase [Candidatus Gracilibacteria bacterium]
MTFLQALLLGILQGITEFLPISSDGHLVLMESIFKLPLADLKGFDVALHFGTLFAIVAYFWRDILSLFRQKKLIVYIVIATLPAVVVGFTLEDWMDATFRNPQAVSLFLLVMAVFFLLAERVAKLDEKKQFTLLNTFVIGVAQALALLPGISRSGMTIGTGLFFGFKREEAARFSFLLGIPAIAGAVFLTGIRILKGEVSLPGTELVLVGFVTSAVIGYLAIAFLMRFLKNHRLTVFAVYLIVVAGVGLWFSR